MVIISILVGLIEIVTAFLFVNLIAKLTSNDTSILPSVLLEKVLAYIDGANSIVLLCVIIIIVYIIKSLFSISQTYLQIKCYTENAVFLSHKLLKKYLSVKYDFHLSHNSGELINNVNLCINLISYGTLMGLSIILSDAFILVAFIILSLTASIPITFIAFFIISLYLIIFYLSIKDKIKEYGRQNQEFASAAQQDIQQILNLIKEIKLGNIVEDRSVIYKEISQKQAHAIQRYKLLSSLPTITAESLLIISISLSIIVLSITYGKIEDFFQLLILYAYIGLRLKPSATKIIEGLNTIKFGQRAIETVLGHFRSEEDKEKKNSVNKKISFKDSIKFENVSYIYPNSEEPSLKNITFSIKKGECVGIVGRTGSGKSTLINLLSGFLEPNNGKIIIDKTNLVDRKFSWWSLVGYVPQHTALLNDSIKNNITLTTFEKKIKLKKLHSAIKMAQLEETISKLPEKVNGIIGENGYKLSGGERQRVAIARALYNDPDIIIFDEATSSLDQNTEKEVFNAIKNLKNKTIMIITHKKSNTSICDKILIMKNGRLTIKNN